MKKVIKLTEEQMENVMPLMNPVEEAETGIMFATGRLVTARKSLWKELRVMFPGLATNYGTFDHTKKELIYYDYPDDKEDSP